MAFLEDKGRGLVVHFCSMELVNLAWGLEAEVLFFFHNVCHSRGVQMLLWLLTISLRV